MPVSKFFIPFFISHYTFMSKWKLSMKSCTFKDNETGICASNSWKKVLHCASTRSNEWPERLSVEHTANAFNGDVVTTHVRQIFSSCRSELCRKPQTVNGSAGPVLRRYASICALKEAIQLARNLGHEITFELTAQVILHFAVIFLIIKQIHWNNPSKQWRVNMASVNLARLMLITAKTHISISSWCEANWCVLAELITRKSCIGL